MRIKFLFYLYLVYSIPNQPEKTRHIISIIVVEDNRKRLKIGLRMEACLQSA